MKILTIDVGTGTTDILLYESENLIENSMKLVIPSSHITISKHLSKIENDVYFNGWIMGGGKLKKRCLEHMEKGYNVAFEPLASKTIRDDLEQVKSYGFEIVKNPNDLKYKNYTKISLKDINLSQIIEIFTQFDPDLIIDEVVIAVQDHGYKENIGDRDFRFEKIKERVPKPLPPEIFAMESKDVPEYFTRMQSLIHLLSKTNPEFKPIIMDTKFASIVGMCNDNYVKNLNSYIVADIGNGHTTVASIEDGKIQGIFEHHTRNLLEDSQKLENLINSLANGTIKHEDVHDDHGHGAFALNPIDKIEKVIVAGPKRKLIEKTNLDYHYATPAGDVMMTGTVGLIKSFEYLRKIKN